ncbi:hypothetical protein CSIRO_0139 [Bradyrhizobiaceae bacterium SG-6C]|nr:hypothetical protein CSIRO_0139 [Bradyrhizobiaceae bacterium SG-6C]
MRGNPVLPCGPAVHASVLHPTGGPGNWTDGDLVKCARAEGANALDFPRPRSGATQRDRR